MIKIKKKKNNSKEKKIKYHYNSWIYIFMFLFSIMCVLLKTTRLDNDIWYILSEGREIVTHGIYHIDPLSMHKGFSIIVQNWLSASIFYIIYSALGEFGLILLVATATFFINLLLYKICMLISDNNRIMSLCCMAGTTLLLGMHFIVSRPQILSFIILLGVIYSLELYIKTNNKKYLIWLPILSLIEVNLHASLWWMIFLFTLPFIIDSFDIPILKTQGYEKKYLFIAIIIALLVGFINPYGYKAITFIFTSYGNKYMHLFINELQPFNFASTLSKENFTIMLGVILLYTIVREGKIRIRYICLFCGTLILGFMSIKGFSHFNLVSFFPLAYFFSDIIPKDLSFLDYKSQKIIKVFSVILALGAITGTCIFLVTSSKKAKLQHDADEAFDIMLSYYKPEDSTVYSSFNNGGYVEFRGYKAYIDPRAEAYLKINNKKANIFKEFYDLQHNKLETKDFIEKYDFTHMLIDSSDSLYSEDLEEYDYKLLYYNEDKKIKLYTKEELAPEETTLKVEKHPY